MTKYAEKLKDPRWQKRRLEILNRDNWTCQQCEDYGSTLHVHHTKYTAGNPWDAPDRNLITLCQDCHYEEKDSFNKHSKELTDTLKDLGFTSLSISELTESFASFLDEGVFHAKREGVEEIDTIKESSAIAHWVYVGVQSPKEMRREYKVRERAADMLYIGAFIGCYSFLIPSQLSDVFPYKFRTFGMI